MTNWQFFTIDLRRSAVQEQQGETRCIAVINKSPCSHVDRWSHFVQDSTRKRVDGLSEELSSEEEEVEVAGQSGDRLIPGQQTKPAPGLRKRLQSATKSATSTKHQVRSTEFL